jgi:hypothetical protein
MIQLLITILYKNMLDIGTARRDLSAAFRRNEEPLDSNVAYGYLPVLLVKTTLVIDFHDPTRSAEK